MVLWGLTDDTGDAVHHWETAASPAMALLKTKYLELKSDVTLVLEGLTHKIWVCSLQNNGPS